jgi:8-oxo-dGTP diphosphatase
VSKSGSGSSAAIDTVQAAGGVVWRRRSDGDEVQVLLVHRPKYDDWTLPKGKAEAGEPDEDCALREVHEETGLRCDRGRAGRVAYDDAKGRPKAGALLDDDRARAARSPRTTRSTIRWLGLKRAAKALTYRRDLPVLESFERSWPELAVDLSDGVQRVTGHGVPDPPAAVERSRARLAPMNPSTLASVQPTFI